MDSLRKLIRAIRPSAISYKGMKIPAKHMRFGGKYFQSNEDFVGSGVLEAKRLETNCGLTPKSAVLEIGCGPGRLPIGIQAHLGSIEKYCAVDVHEPSIRWCKKYIEKKSPNFSFVHIEVSNERYNVEGKESQEETKLPFEDESFDIVYLYSVFSHLLEKDVRAYLKEFERLLRPSGKVFLTAFVEENVPDVSENPSDYKDGKWKGALHCVRYDKEFLEKMFTENGFTVDKFDYGVETDGQSGIYLSKSA